MSRRVLVSILGASSLLVSGLAAAPASAVTAAKLMAPTSARAGSLAVDDATGTFYGINPTRFLDTRKMGTKLPLAKGSTTTLQIGGRADSLGNASRPGERLGGGHQRHRRDTRARGTSPPTPVTGRGPPHRRSTSQGLDRRQHGDRPARRGRQDQALQLRRRGPRHRRRPRLVREGRHACGRPRAWAPSSSPRAPAGPGAASTTAGRT